jgi:hypothetical protein
VYYPGGKFVHDAGIGLHHAFDASYVSEIA